MKNFLLSGKCLELTAPAGGVVSGGAYLHGGLLVVAAADAAATEKYVGESEGVYELPKEATTAVFVEGEICFWDNTAKRFDETAAGRFPVGTAVKAAGSSATTVFVKLTGHAVAAV
jgi:predicted RecA/RadA family phage recombinase